MIVIVKKVNRSDGINGRFRFVINITKYDCRKIENMHNIYVLHINALYAVKICVIWYYTVDTYLIFIWMYFFSRCLTCRLKM